MKSVFQFHSKWSLYLRLLEVSFRSLRSPGNLVYRFMRKYCTFIGFNHQVVDFKQVHWTLYIFISFLYPMCSHGTCMSFVDHPNLCIEISNKKQDVMFWNVINDFLSLFQECFVCLLRAFIFNILPFNQKLSSFT